MKKTLSILLTLAMLVTLLSVGSISANAADTNAIIAEINSTYSALRASHGSYDNWCGQFVHDQLNYYGICSNKNGDGNQWYGLFSDGEITTGGYQAHKFAGANCLNDIVATYGSEVYNVVVSFPVQYGYSAANPGAGHVVFIRAIVNGYVYFCESYSSGGYAEGQAQSRTISAFISAYSNSYQGVIGAIYLSGGTTSHNPVGVLDSVVADENGGAIRVRGWTFDVDDYSVKNDVHVYIGGPAGSANAEGHIISSGTYRPDVNNVYKCGDYHGFDSTIKTNKRGNQDVYVYAINNAGDGVNVQIGKGTVYIETDISNITIDDPESYEQYWIEFEKDIATTEVSEIEVPVYYSGNHLTVKSFVLDVEFDENRFEYIGCSSESFTVTKETSEGGKTSIEFVVDETARRKAHRMKDGVFIKNADYWWWGPSAATLKFAVKSHTAGETTITAYSPLREENLNYDGSNFEINEASSTIRFVEPKIISGNTDYVLAFDDVVMDEKTSFVEVPLYVISNKVNVYATEFELCFDPTVLKYQSVNIRHSGIGFSPKATSNFSGGSVKFMSETSDINGFNKGYGIVALFKFEVIGNYGDQSSIVARIGTTGSNIDSNGNDISVLVASGSVKLPLSEPSITEPSVTETEPSITEPSVTETEPSVTEPSEPTALLLGDANNDNAVNMKDVLALRKFLAGMDVSIDMTNSDTNEDMFVNMKDVLLMRKFLANLIDKLGA